MTLVSLKLTELMPSKPGFVKLLGRQKNPCSDQAEKFITLHAQKVAL